MIGASSRERLASTSMSNRALVRDNQLSEGLQIDQAERPWVTRLHGFRIGGGDFVAAVINLRGRLLGARGTRDRNNSCCCTSAWERYRRSSLQTATTAQSLSSPFRSSLVAPNRALAKHLHAPAAPLHCAACSIPMAPSALHSGTAATSVQPSATTTMTTTITPTTTSTRAHVRGAERGAQRSGA